MTAPSMSLSHALIALLKGVLDRAANEALWQTVMEQQAQVRDYVALLGLELVLDDAEGCAYLRQRSVEEGQAPLPRLVPRRPLSYPVSLMLALLRKRLVELDVKTGETRLIVSRDDLAEMMRLFLPASGNEARFMDRMDAHVNKIIDLGFLRKLSGQDGQYEVLRILKAYVDAQWLADFDERLKAYHGHATVLANDGSEPS